MASLTQVSFLLHRPRSLDNVGAVARIVKNFGLGRLWLVEPLSYSFDRAEKLAVGAADVLEHLFVERDLATALGGFVLSVGTSSRPIQGRPSLSPSEVAHRLADATGPCVVVFGDEKRGLSDDELSLCQVVCRIPSEPSQPSLNLAQACAVMGYSIAVRPAPEPVASEPSATHSQLDSLRSRLSAVLGAADFLNLQNPDPVLRELMRPFERAALSGRELELWNNALRKTLAGIDRGRQQ